jgi:hypothetical protein
LVIIGTNAGTANSWQWNWRQIAFSSPRWSTHVWDRPAPWLDPAEVAEAELRNSRTRYLRLFWGKWSSGAGDALDPEAISDALVLTGPMTRPVPGWSFVAGLDLGLSRDHAAFVVLGCEQGQNRIALCHCQSWKPAAGQNVDLAEIERTIIGLHRRFHFRGLHYDPWQCELLAQNLRRAGIASEPMHFVGQNLNIMASTLLEVFATRMIDLYDDKQLVRDLHRLTITEKSYGVRLEATKDAEGHADRATALAIALPAAASLAHCKAQGALIPSRHSFDRFGFEPTNHGIQLSVPHRH